MSTQLNAGLEVSDEERASHNEFSMWALENKKWVDIYINYGERQSVMNAILEASGQRELTWKTVMSKFIRYANLELRTRTFKVCSGHMAFSNWQEFSNNSISLDANVCCICLSPPQQTAYQGRNLFHYIPLKPRLERMFLSPDCCEELYGYDIFHQSGIWNDFCDGRSFENILNRYGGYEQVKQDIFIAVSTDGFQPFQHSDEEVWPILAIILNLSPSIRYKVANVVPLGFAPGPSPSNLQSFLASLLHELRDDIGEDGSNFQFYDGVERRVRVHVVWVMGDLPVVAKLAGLQGHNAKRPCRFCTISGVWSARHRHYYYPSRVKLTDGTWNELYDISCLPPRTVDNVQNSYDLLSNSSQSQLLSIRTETGVKEKSILFSLPTLVPFTSFPIDAMHLLYNVSREMIGLFVAGSTDAGLLSKGQVEFIDSTLDSFRSGLSSSFAPRPTLLSKFKTWKAAEHKRFVLDYSLIVLEGMLPVQYLDGWRKFVLFYDLVCRKSLDQLEVDRIGTLAESFLNFVEERFFQFEVGTVSVCKYVFHLLLHVKENILENGPTICHSQFWVERYIGSIVARLNAKRLPATALYRAALFNEAAKTVYGTAFQNDEQVTQAPVAGNRHVLRGSSRKINLVLVDRSGIVRRALKYFFARKYSNITSIQCQDIMNSISSVHAYSRFSMKIEDVEELFRCCASVKDFSAVDTEYESSCYVAVHMNESDTEASLYYGRIRSIIQVQIDSSLLVDGSLVTNVKQCHDLLVMDWAVNLEVGLHDQIRSHRARHGTFTHLSVEDISIVQRKIGVVENNIPTRFSGQANKKVIRSHRVSSFIDKKVREDYILRQNVANVHGKNIRLQLRN